MAQKELLLVLWYEVGVVYWVHFFLKLEYRLFLTEECIFVIFKQITDIVFALAQLQRLPIGVYAELACPWHGWTISALPQPSDRGVAAPHMTHHICLLLSWSDPEWPACRLQPSVGRSRRTDVHMLLCVWSRETPSLGHLQPDTQTLKKRDFMQVQLSLL